jgi:hypothetical protein
MMTSSCFRIVLSCIFILYCLYCSKEVHGHAKTYGSLELRYQRMETEAHHTYSSGQRLQLNFSDDLWVKNRLVLSIDLVRNQYSQQERPDFRPRFSLDLSGYKYRAYYSLAFYKTYGSSGQTTNHRVTQVNLSTDPAKWPSLGFSYRQTHAFDDSRSGDLDNLSRYWTVSSRWQYKSLTLRGTHLRQEGINKLTETRTYLLSAVTGAAKFSLDLPLRTTTSWDYDFSYTRRESAGAVAIRTPSHSFSTRWGGRPWSFFRWSADYQGKVVETKHDRLASKKENQSFYGRMEIGLTGKWDIGLTRGSTLSRSGGERSSTDYLSLITTLRSLQITDDVEATTSFRRSHYIHGDAGKYNLDLFYLSSRMKIYRGVESHFDFSVKHNDSPLVRHNRYELVKNLTVTTSPRDNLTIDFNYKTNVTAEKMIFIHSDVENYRLDFTYRGKRNLNLHSSYQANLYKWRGIPNSHSLLGEMSYTWGNASSSNIVYQRRWSEDPNTGQMSSTDNLSSQLNLSLGERSKLALTYNVSDLSKPTSSSSLGVTLNQRF